MMDFLVGCHLKAEQIQELNVTGPIAEGDGGMQPC